MAQYIKQGNIFGRIGSGVGKGLAEQLPKEIERSRLSSGLKSLGEKKELSPFQQFAELSSIPGVTPQMIQSGSELLRQQGIGEGLRKTNQRDESRPFERYQNNNQSQKEGSKSITTTDPLQSTINPVLPRTREQKLNRASELYENERQLYPTPQDAITAVENEEQTNQNINNALQNQRKGQQDVQSRVQNELRTAAQNAGINIPGGTSVPDTVYQEIENKALDDVNNGERTELEAAKHYKKELDKVAREYQALDTVGNIDYLLRDKQDIKRNLREIRKGFKERDDLENLADSYISKNGLSPGKAYYLAYPPSETKELNNLFSRLPELKPEATTKRGFSETRVDPEKAKQKTLKIAPQLAEAMGKQGSPLAIAEELKARNYDEDAWLDYLGKNRKSLDLSERQGRELQKPKNTFPTLNDNWLFYFSGLDKLVEQ